MTSSHPPPGLRLIALWVGAKGTLVLLAGIGVLHFLHRDVHAFVERLLRHFQLNPARHYPRILLDAAATVTDGRLWALAAGALCYAILHFAEAWGLWRDRHWALWLGVVSSGVFLPLEIFEVGARPNLMRVALLAINVMVTAYLSRVLWQERRTNVG